MSMWFRPPRYYSLMGSVREGLITIGEVTSVVLSTAWPSGLSRMFQGSWQNCSFGQLGTGVGPRAGDYCMLEALKPGLVKYLKYLRWTRGGLSGRSKQMPLSEADLVQEDQATSRIAQCR